MLVLERYLRWDTRLGHPYPVPTFLRVLLRLRLERKSWDKSNCPNPLSQPSSIAITSIWGGWDTYSIYTRERPVVNWSEILSNAGIPDPPGYLETVASVRSNPRVKSSNKSNKSKKKPVKSRHEKSRNPPPGRSRQTSF